MLAETLEHCGAVVSAYQSADACIADLGEVVPDRLRVRLVDAEPQRASVSCGGYVSYRQSVAGGFPPSRLLPTTRTLLRPRPWRPASNAYMMKPIRLEQLCRLIRELTEQSVAS